MSTTSSSLHQESEGPASERVLAAIATRDGVDPVDFHRPLYDVIEPDALDALFQSDLMDGRVTFAYRDYEVTVCSDGTIELDHVDG